MSLFKYLHPDRVDVLERLQIRFTQASSQNDIFEFKPVTKGWKPPADAIRHFAEALTSRFAKADSAEKMLQMAIADHPEAEARFRQNISLIGEDEWLRQMKKFAEENFESEAQRMSSKIEANWNTYSDKMFQSLSSSLGILSLTEDPQSVVMWGHYAHSGQGFLLEFNENHGWFSQKAFENDDFRQLRQVEYLKSPEPKYFSELTVQEVCYSKLDSWSYEKEWRVIQELRHGIDTGVQDQFGQPVIVFSIPPDCIVGVTIGPKTTQARVAAIKGALCSPDLRHVKLSEYRSDPSNRKF